MFWNERQTKTGYTPPTFHFKLIASVSLRTEEESQDMAQISYATVVSSLMYVTVCQV